MNTENIEQMMEWAYGITPPDVYQSAQVELAALQSEITRLTNAARNVVHTNLDKAQTIWTQWEPVAVPIVCACPDPRCTTTITPVPGNDDILEIDVRGRAQIIMILPDDVRLMIRS